MAAVPWPGALDAQGHAVSGTLAMNQATDPLPPLPPSFLAAVAGLPSSGVPVAPSPSHGTGTGGVAPAPVHAASQPDGSLGHGMTGPGPYNWMVPGGLSGVSGQGAGVGPGAVPPQAGMGGMFGLGAGPMYPGMVGGGPASAGGWWTMGLDGRPYPSGYPASGGNPLWAAMAAAATGNAGGGMMMGACTRSTLWLLVHWQVAGPG
jgi:hypothetical protein